MTALAKPQFFASVGFVAVGSSDTAKRVEQLTHQAFFDIKSKLADKSLGFNELHTLYEEREEAVLEGRNYLDDATYNLGKCFLLSLPTSFPAPEVSLHEDGELSFDWFGKWGRNFSASLRNDGRLAYAGKLGPTSNSYGTERFDSAVPKTVLDGIKAML